MNWTDSHSSIYNVVGDLFERGFDSTVVDFVLRGKRSAFNYLEAMMEATSAGYGDPGLLERPVSHETRIPAMSTTDLYTSLGLTQNFRTPRGTNFIRDSLTFLGPSDSPDVFTGAIPYQFVVKDNSTSFFLSIEESSKPLQTCVTRTSPILFSMKQWDDWPLYPRNETVGSYLLSKEKIPECFETGVMTEPFGGQPPSGLIAALMGSTPLLEISGLSPLSLAQAISTAKEVIRTSGQSNGSKRINDFYMDLIAQSVYLNADRLAGTAICNQFPNRCGIHDALFSHKGCPDLSALVQSIAQQQISNEGGSLRPVKAIVTYHGTNFNGFLQYFRTFFNRGIAPGDYIWLPYSATNWRSMEVFEEYLDYWTLQDILTPVQGIPVSTAIINTTTVDSPMLHIQAGQSVEILLLAYTEEDLPIDWFGPLNSAFFGGEARDIASSTELLARVQEFLAI